MTDSTPSVPLLGRTIALPSSADSKRLDEGLRALGAKTVLCPLVAMVDAPDLAAIDDFLVRLVAGEIDDLVLLTGEGLRRLIARANDTGCKDAVLSALTRVRTIARGPKPAQALRDLGLPIGLQPTIPTSAGIEAALRGKDLRGRRVGIQLHGDTVVPALVTFFTSAGAQVHTVKAYGHAPASDDDRIAQTLAGLHDGTIDAIAFTNTTQVDRLFDVADRRGWLSSLKAALDRAVVASIGPMVTEALTDRSIRVDITLDAPYSVARLCEALAARLGVGG